MKTSIVILLLFISSYTFGQQLVYTPKNPAFGGDTFNYGWLLNSANAQNSFEDDDLFGGFDSLDSFNSSLGGNFNGIGNNQTPDIGTSTEGNLHYEVYESTEGLVINVLDITTGEQSQIIIPN